MKKNLYYIFGIIVCCCFWGAFAYAVGFFSNLGVSKSIDSGQEGPMLKSLSINMLLILSFGVQHSIMARKGFKKIWTKIVPDPLERSVYVLFASAIVWLTMLKWQPMTLIIWDIQNNFLKTICYLFFLGGASMAVYSIFLLNHFDYIGLRQIHLHFKIGRYQPLKFKTPTIYKYIRHPMTFGMLIFFLATPKMTIGHFLLAAGMTLYSVIGLKLEEMDLIDEFGEKYKGYKQEVGMVLPKLMPKE